MCSAFYQQSRTSKERMKKGKKQETENQARRQRDDKVRLKHTSTHKEHDSLLELFVCTYECQIKLSAHCLLEPLAFNAAGP